MELKMKLARKFSRFERQKLGVAVLAGCFLATMTLVSLPKPHAVPSPTLGLSLSLHAAEDTLNSRQSEDIRLENGTQEMKPIDGNSSTTSLDSSGGEEAKTTAHLGNTNEKQEITSICDDPKSDQCGMVGDTRLPNNSSSTISYPIQKANARDSDKLGNINEKQETSHICDPKSDQCEIVGDTTLPNNSSSTITDPNQKTNTKDSDKLDSRGENENPERTPLCNVSDPRSDICEMEGDIRIHGNSSSITFVAHSQIANSEGNNSWRIKPYARKGDNNAFSHVREVFVRLKGESPHCTHNHSIPAIVFSIGGYTGNLFHDFTDVLIPLFLTANQFDGEVQFLVSDMSIWWVRKYELALQKLSRYPIIDFDKDDGVHCFPHVIVGLHCHKELSIDPSRSPNGYSMVDFTRFLRSSYSLEREAPIRIGEQLGKKPRLLIISRKRTRAFLNVDEIVHMAEELGYQVVVEEANVGSDIARFAHVVNSCDVMMGVHGAGLTNLVFLPTNATLIQIVPWGGLQWISMLDFGEPAKDMKLRYMQYSIGEEETSLIETYPRDHPVFKDPFSFHNKGWNLLRNMFMDKQNVRLDVRRFRAVLLEVLESLN